EKAQFMLTWREYEQYVTERAEQIVREGLTRTMFPLREWIEVAGIETEDLLEQFTLTYPYIEQLFNAVDYYLDEGYIKEAEMELLVNTMLMLSALAEEYRRTKQKYFRLHKEEWEFQLQEKEKEWQSLLKEKEIALDKAKAKYSHLAQVRQRELAH